MGIIWTIIIGFLAGLIARWIHPGVSNEPSGFVLTTLLGIAGAFVATFLGQAIGCIMLAKVPGSSEPLWVQSSCLSYGECSQAALKRSERIVPGRVELSAS